MRNIGFICLLALRLLLAGNSESIIKGIVTDEKGKPLTFANIYLKDRLEGSTSDRDGYFSFKVSKPGKVTVICTYVGYREYRKEIEIKAGETIELKIVLREAPVRGKGITVTASAFTSGDEEGVTLTPLEVVSTPGAAADVFWAIKTYPGVQQVEEGAGLFVRGGDVSETAVILDGAYLNHPYRYESPNGGFFGTISPFLLKGTFFSSGGYSAEFGNALSGALVMESMDIPAKNQYTLGAGLAAFSAAGKRVIQPDKLGVSFSGNYSNTRTMFELNHNRRKFSRYPRAYDANANLFYRYSPHGSLKLFLFREVDEVGVEVKNPTYGGFYQGNSKNNLINLQWKHLPNPKLLLKSNVAFSNFVKDQNLVVLDLKSDEQLYQGRWIAEYTTGENARIRAGMEVFENVVRLKGQVPKEYLDLNPDAPTKRVDSRYRSLRGVIFGEGQWLFGSRLRFTPGLRGEYESISGQFIWDPRLSAAYSLSREWNLTAAAGRYHQFPQPYYYDSYAGNPSLNSMRAWHYIIGIAHQRENSIIRVEAYYKDYDHLLLKDERLNYTNRGYGYARGLDLFLKKSLGIINGWISYSYLQARRFWMDAPSLSSPDFDITHNLSAVLEVSLTPHLHLGSSFRAATGKPYTSAPHRYHNARVPDYRKLDLNLTYLYRFFEGNLTVFYLAVSNVLGRENVFDYYYSPDYKKREAITSSMLRSVYFGVSINF